MVTKAEALAAYNEQHKTEYATVQALAIDLTSYALREAWLIKKRNEAQEAAAVEVIE